MAKFYGLIGFVETAETKPGVWEEVVIAERPYYGDVLRNARRYENSENLNDNINLNNMISIIGDAYAYEHFFAMRYLDWMGSSWKITNVEVQTPRLILTLGGIYNGPKNRPTCNTC